ncbi:MAG: hypothetical protein ABEK04_00030 [Candidatus Nanohalobium sp.]
MEETEALDAVEQRERKIDEEFRDNFITEELIRPQNRAFLNTEFTTDTSEVDAVFEASEEPVFDVDHPGDYSFETRDFDWNESSVDQASQLYKEVAGELEDIFGKESVIHFFESHEVPDDLKTSDKVESGSEKYKLWMYFDGEPHMVVEGLVPEGERPRLDRMDGDKFEIDHYLEEGHYMDEDEVIELRVPSGEEINRIMEAEADPENVEELEEAWKQYNQESVGRVSWESDYADAYEKVKDMDYSPEDVRKFAWNHRRLRDDAGAREEQRFGLMISALMNSSSSDAFAVPGYWGLGYSNEGNDIFLEKDAPWVGHSMDSGTITAKYGIDQIGISEDNVEYETEDFGYLEVIEARKKHLEKA